MSVRPAGTTGRSPMSSRYIETSMAPDRDRPFDAGDLGAEALGQPHTAALQTQQHDAVDGRPLRSRISCAMRVIARRTSSGLSTSLPGARAGPLRSRHADSSSVRASRDPLHGRIGTVPRRSARRTVALIGVRGTVVMATYNEAASIGPVLAEVEEAATILRRAGIELNVLLVDDDSPDGTAAVARREAATLRSAPRRDRGALVASPALRSSPASGTSLTADDGPASSSPSTPTAATTPARSPISCACSWPAAAG